MPNYLAGSQIGLVWKEPAPGLRQDYTLGRGEERGGGVLGKREGGRRGEGRRGRTTDSPPGVAALDQGRW